MVRELLTVVANPGLLGGQSYSYLERLPPYINDDSDYFLHFEEAW